MLHHDHVLGLYSSLLPCGMRACSICCRPHTAKCSFTCHPIIPGTCGVAEIIRRCRIQALDSLMLLPCRCLLTISGCQLQRTDISEE